MNEFLPARQDIQATSIRDFYTERDGESRCLSCQAKSSGRVEICRAVYDHVLLRTCQKIEGGAVVPVRGWDGRYTDVRLRMESIKDVQWDTHTVGDIVQSGHYYEILEFQPGSECLHRHLSWNIQSTYNEQRDVLALIDHIDNDGLYFMLNHENSSYYAGLLSRYRNVFTKDQILRFMVAMNEGTALQLKHLTNAVQQLADRVVGAGHSLLGGR